MKKTNQEDAEKQKADKKALRELAKMRSDEKKKKQEGLKFEDSTTENTDLEFTYDQIPLGQISVEGQSIREKIDDDHVVELASSMAKNGLLQPISVLFVANNSYQLIGGFHRLTAAHRLQWKTIPAHIKKGKIQSLKGLACVENLVRLNMTFPEECKAVETLYNIEKKSPSQICDMTGKSRQWVDRRLAAGSMQEEIKDAMFENQITIAVAEELSKCKDEGQRRYLLGATIQQRWTKSVVSAMVENANSTPNIQEAIAAGHEQAIQAATKPAFVKICQGCGMMVDMTELAPFWMHKNGCPQTQAQEGIKQ